MNNPILVLILLIFVSCGQNTDVKKDTNKAMLPETETGQEKSIAVALTFLNSYVDNCNKMKKSIGVIEWVTSNILTTKGFKKELMRIMNEADKLEPEVGIDADPIFNAQDYPENGFELDSFDTKSNYIIFKGKNRPEFKLTIKMVLENKNWLVDGCGMINIPNDSRIEIEKH